MENQEKSGLATITEDEVHALSNMIEGILTTWEPSADARENEQLKLVMSLLDKVEDVVSR